MGRSNIEILKDSYAAFGRGDLATVMRNMHPQVDWQYAGPSEIPWAGSFRGEGGVKTFFAAVAARADIEVFKPQTFVEGGDTVVVLGFERLRSRDTGQACDTHWAHAYTFAEDKIVKFREYTDTAAVASIFRRQESA